MSICNDVSTEYIQHVRSYMEDKTNSLPDPELLRILIKHDKQYLIDYCEKIHNILVCYIEEHRRDEAVLLIQAGVGLEDHVSLLHYAADWGDCPVFELLLDTELDIDTCDEFGSAPIHIACKNGHRDIVRLLIRKNCDLNISDDESLSTPLHIASEMCHSDIVKILLDSGAEVDMVDMKNRTPLYIASKKGHDDTVRILLDSGADMEIAKNNLKTPLLISFENGHDNVVELLVRAGAKRDTIDGSILNLAARNGRTEIAHLLLELGMDASGSDDFGYTPLDHACESGYEDIVILLLEKKARHKTDLVNVAVGNDSISMLKILLESGLDPNIADMEGRTALHHASRAGYENIVRLLLQFDVLVDTVDNYGYTPLNLAALKGHENVMQMLREAGSCTVVEIKYGTMYPHRICGRGD